MERKRQNKLELKLNRLRLLRVKNTQDKMEISYQILEEDIEPDLRQSLIYSIRLLETIDQLLGLLEGVGAILLGQKKEIEKSQS
jgi:hypothetical protein